MIRIRFTQEDLLRGKVLEPGWYSVKVRDITEQPASTDGSTNYVWELVVTGGPKQKDGSVPVGVPLTRHFNEKVLGFMQNAVKAFSGGKVEADKDYDIGGINGRSCQVYVDNELWQNVMRNRVQDFRPGGEQ